MCVPNYILCPKYIFSCSKHVEYPIMYKSKPMICNRHYKFVLYKDVYKFAYYYILQAGSVAVK